MGDWLSWRWWDWGLSVVWWGDWDAENYWAERWGGRGGGCVEGVFWGDHSGAGRMSSYTVSAIGAWARVGAGVGLGCRRGRGGERGELAVVGVGDAVGRSGVARSVPSVSVLPLAECSVALPRWER